MEEYRIRSGDTLSKVARRLGVPLHLLIEVNRITDPNKIRVGQILSVPNVTTDTADHPIPAEPPPAPAVEAPELSINRDRFRLPPSQFVQEETQKDMVMLHFTAGSSAQGAFSSWIGTEARVATAYILDRDGTVYELFDPRFWAFHLGIRGAAGAGFKHDRRSVGIEIVNVGPLREREGNLCWWPNDFNTTWCKLADQDLYKRASYRGFSHYATFTGSQYDSLAALVRLLCARFAIPAKLPPATRRGVADPAGFFKDWSGIASHQNFREDKFDVGPAFDWQRLNL